MDQITGNLPALITVLLVAALLFFVGARLGVGFLIRRLAGALVVLVAVSVVTFLLGVIQEPYAVVYTQCGVKCTPLIVHQLAHFYHLDEPWYQQYAEYVTGLIHFDFGFSWLNRERSVWDILGSGVPISIELGVMATVLQIALGIPLGMLAALRTNTWVDTAISGLSLSLLALPTYLLIIVYFLVTELLARNGLPHLPVAGWGQPIDAVMPVAILGFGGMGFYMRLARTSLLDVIGQDYIRTAKAKGVRLRVVLYKHALRNALVPLVTALGPSVAFVVTGFVFTEALFNIPGIGYWTVESLVARDMPVLQATTNLGTLALVLLNLVVDISYGFLDPRIRVI
jgi:ABC-type dipeptide/oligopeptide/nickel transport system permease component